MASSFWKRADKFVWFWHSLFNQEFRKVDWGGTQRRHMRWRRPRRWCRRVHGRRSWRQRTPWPCSRRTQRRRERSPWPRQGEAWRQPWQKRRMWSCRRKCPRPGRVQRTGGLRSTWGRWRERWWRWFGGQHPRLERRWSQRIRNLRNRRRRWRRRREGRMNKPRPWRREWRWRRSWCRWQRGVELRQQRSWVPFFFSFLFFNKNSSSRFEKYINISS